MVIGAQRIEGVIAQKRGLRGKLVVWNFERFVDQVVSWKRTESGVVHLDCVLLTAFEILRFPRRIAALAVVADSYGVAEEAGGAAEVAGAAVSDVVVATDWLLR